MRSVWRTSFRGRGIQALCLLTACGIIFGYIISATAEETEASSYDLEFQTVNISGTVGGSASYSVEDTVSHMGNGSGRQASGSYSVGSLFETDGETGIDDHHWTGLR